MSQQAEGLSHFYTLKLKCTRITSEFLLILSNIEYKKILWSSKIGFPFCRACNVRLKIHASGSHFVVEGSYILSQRAVFLIPRKGEMFCQLENLKTFQTNQTFKSLSKKINHVFDGSGSFQIIWKVCKQSNNFEESLKDSLKRFPLYLYSKNYPD